MPQNSFTTQLKGSLNKWRLWFLIFALVYGAVLIFGFMGMRELSYTSIQWDEVTHFNGGTLLLRGDFNTYFNFNAFYPPLYDLVTAGFFSVAGINVFSGRFVAVVFSILSLFAVFEFTYRNYGPKTALLASAFLGLMPGYFWLSRMAMIETMLVFFFTISTLFFLSWLRTHQDKFLILSGLTLGLGILTKYQMIIVGAIMINGIFILGRNYLKKRLRRCPLLILAAAAIVIPWILVSYQIYASGMLNQWLYALSIGNPEKSLYSIRFPTPIFYLIEMTMPYPNVHPISFFLYILGLAGLGLLAWRRKPEDKYLLIWFSVVYVFFTIIANKQWRYVLPIFPVLAISSATLIATALDKTKKALTFRDIGINKKRVLKAGAGLLIATTVIGAAFSINDAYSWVAKDQIQIPIEAATNYAANRLSENESIMVMCAQNLYSQDMVKFYLIANQKTNKVWQYPELPVDTYTPNFNITEFVNLCKNHNVKYVFTYEFGGNVPYFNTTLSLMGVYQMLYESGKFVHLSGNADIETLIKEGTVPAFGTNPRRIIILTFLG
jgi:hypothetical protein